MTYKQSADAYADATDSTRHLLRWTQEKVRQWQRIKPDEELYPLAGLDFEKEPTRVEQIPQATPLRASTCV